MFFTITTVESVVVDLDSFENSGELFDQVLDLLQSKGYELVLVTEQASTSLGTRGLPVVAATNWTEGRMFQSVIRRALQSIGARPSRSVFLAADARHLRNAAELLMGTAVITPENISDHNKIVVCQNFPDFIVDSIEWLEKALSGELIGYGGEYYAARKPAVFQPSNIKKVQYPAVPSEEHPDCPVNLAGRYFGADDPRHSLHALSIRIVHSKRKPEVQASMFADTFGQAIATITEGEFDMVCCVPPRPEKENRLKHFLDPLPGTRALSEVEDIERKIVPGLIVCVRDYPDLKRLNRQERREALNGAFQVEQDLTGQVIVLLDDVRTTGSTMDEAIRALKAAGAARVIPIVLGYHPFPVSTIALTDKDESYCTKAGCQKALVARANSKTGEPFYGCSGWTPESGGHGTMNLTDAVLAKLGSFEERVMQPDAEVGAGDIEF